LRDKAWSRYSFIRVCLVGSDGKGGGDHQIPDARRPLRDSTTAACDCYKCPVGPRLAVYVHVTHLELEGVSGGGGAGGATTSCSVPTSSTSTAPSLRLAHTQPRA
jgi:hypothetical protein